MYDTYLILKSLHVLAASVFLGNIIVTGWWKVMADKTRNPGTVAFAQRQVTLTDFIFTAGGAIAILATGIGNAVLHQIDYWQVQWTAWGMYLFIASGIIWVAVLIPIQIKQARMAREFGASGTIPGSYWRLGRIWIAFGILATVLPMINVFIMVIKPL